MAGARMSAEGSPPTVSWGKDGQTGMASLRWQAVKVSAATAMTHAANRIYKMYIELRCFMAYLLSFLVFIVASWIRFVKVFEMPFYSYRRKKSRGVTENLKKIEIFWEM
jgi:hypothetical protein